MPTYQKLLSALGLIVVIGIGVIFFKQSTQPSINVAIANYGPHASLSDCILGFQNELTSLIESTHKDKIRYEIADVNFDQPLIPQMLTKLKATQPRVILTLGTPVTQSAQASIHTLPIVFAGVTDPAVLYENDNVGAVVGGASDRQDLRLLLSFARQLLPGARRVGLLYSVGEANDSSLLHMLAEAAEGMGMVLVPMPVEHARDVPTRVSRFKKADANNSNDPLAVDFIYVGVSGAIQPALPVIAAAADKEGIPVFNADSAAVLEGIVLASFGVDYYQVGVQAARLAYDAINIELARPANAPVEFQQVGIVNPKILDHKAFISRRKAQKLGITLPDNLVNVTVVE